jgi:trehalose 6-phosphate phosphatase
MCRPLEAAARWTAERKFAKPTAPTVFYEHKIRVFPLCFRDVTVPKLKGLTPSSMEVVENDALVQMDTLLRAVALARQSVLMLDYDGTLAPFRKNRQEAFPYPGIYSILQEILRSSNTRVVIISGRDAQEVPALLKVEPRPEVWGLHGLQRLRTDGSVELFPFEEDIMQALAAARKWLREENLEDAAEFKRGSIALHWRGLGRDEAKWARERALLGWSPLTRQSGLELLEFDGGLEIRASGSDKGDAVRAILEEMPARTPAAYLGDDETDEAGFQAIDGKGLSILVRPKWRRTAAQIWLRPPGGVLDFLKEGGKKRRL